MLSGYINQPSPIFSFVRLAGHLERGNDWHVDDLRRRGLDTLQAVDLAWGSVIGSALQFGMQLPVVLRLTRKLPAPPGYPRGACARSDAEFRALVFISRGAVQISGYVDQVIASLVGAGAVTALTYAQSITTLPVSLFGMAISVAELPAMSSALGDQYVAGRGTTGKARLDSGLRRIAFFVVPSAVAFLALGDVMTAALYQTGKFTHDDSIYVWAILAGSSVGLAGELSTLGRLYSSTYYALRDTRTPLRFALVRVTLTTVLGYLCAILLPRWLGIDARWGMAGLTASAGVAGWVEFALLRRTLNKRIGRTGLTASLGQPGCGALWQRWRRALLWPFQTRSWPMYGPLLSAAVNHWAVTAGGLFCRQLFAAHCRRVPHHWC